MRELNLIAWAEELEDRSYRHSFSATDPRKSKAEIATALAIADDFRAKAAFLRARTRDRTARVGPVLVSDDERRRMEGTHQPLGQPIVKSLGAKPTTVCSGCGMDWPCPARRLLDLPRPSRWSLFTMALRRRRA